MASDGTIQIDIGSSSPIIEGHVSSGITITPGEFVVQAADGTYTNAHSPLVWGPNGRDLPLIAVEDLASGKTIDDTYAEGEKLYMRYLRPGDEFLGWLKDGTVPFGGPVVIREFGLLRYSSTLQFNKLHVGIAQEPANATGGKARFRCQAAYS